MTWCPVAHESQPAFSATDGHMRVTVLPEIGAKIISIMDLRSGQEYVWRHPGRALRRIPAGTAFSDGDASGLDDCMPTIDPCTYTGASGRPIMLSGHGDVWRRPWSTVIDGDSLELSVQGRVDAPYQLHKRLTLADQRLLVSYRIATLGPTPLTFQWTGHLLFRAVEGGRIALSGHPTARTAFATGGRLRSEPDLAWTWPMAPGTNGSPVDMSVMPAAATGVNEKPYLRAPTDGCCMITAPHRRTAMIEFDPTLLPWLAICTNYGGWPDRDPGYWVAIEPSTSSSDALADSAAAGNAVSVEPGNTLSWWWALRLAEPDDVGRHRRHDQGHRTATSGP
jgi:galactose mutarotase-like enzyme